MLKEIKKFPSVTANVSYENKQQYDSGSPIQKKKAKRALKFDDESDEETIIWQNKEKSKAKGMLSCWSETDSVDDLLLKFTELENMERKKQEPEQVPGCCTWDSPKRDRM